MQDFIPGMVNQDFPQCPHCGCEFHKVEESMVTDDTKESMECRECNKTFSFTTHVTVRYSTHVVEE